MSDMGRAELGITSLSGGAGLRPPSNALRQLLSAVIDTGIGPHQAGRVVHAVLSTFLQRVPEGERRHVAAHLPSDVRRLATTRQRVGRSSRPARTAAELTAQIMTADGMSAEQAARVIAAVLGALRVLVPEEAADIASVLPAELLVLWDTAPGVSARPSDDPRERGGRCRSEEIAMATTALEEGARLARAVVRQLGGRFSVELGIDVDAGDAEIDRWFVAATLFGTRFSTTVAERAFRVLDENGITRIAHASERTWSELVELLDAADWRAARAGTPAPLSCSWLAGATDPRTLPLPEAVTDADMTGAVRGWGRGQGPLGRWALPPGAGHRDDNHDE